MAQKINSVVINNKNNSNRRGDRCGRGPRLDDRQGGDQESMLELPQVIMAIFPKIPILARNLCGKKCFNFSFLSSSSFVGPSWRQSPALVAPESSSAERSVSGWLTTFFRRKTNYTVVLFLACCRNEKRYEKRGGTRKQYHGEGRRKKFFISKKRTTTPFPPRRRLFKFGREGGGGS